MASATYPSPSIVSSSSSCSQATKEAYHPPSPSQSAREDRKEEGRLEGTVVGRLDTYGFIKGKTTECRYFFHEREAEGGVGKGCKVSFRLTRDESTGKEMAVEVRRVNTGKKQGEKREESKEEVPGRYEGTIIVLPKERAEAETDDGLLAFEDESGEEKHALFGKWRCQEASMPSTVSVGDRVSFSLVKLKNGVMKATGVVCLSSRDKAEDQRSEDSDERAEKGAGSNANDASDDDAENARRRTNEPEVLDPSKSSPQSTKKLNESTTQVVDTNGTSLSRERGRVALLKKEFGFIRQISRPGDVFFHFSQVRDTEHGEIKVGQDVEFTMQVSKPGRKSALDVHRIAPGLVVFEQISMYILRGIVTSPPSLGKEYRDAIPGIIEFDSLQAVTALTAGDMALHGLVQSPVGKAHILFYSTDLPKNKKRGPRIGDHVTFRVKLDVAAAAAAMHAANPMAAALGARRAIDVRVVRCCGVVESIQQDRHFGFIQFREIDDRVHGNQDKLKANVGAHAEEQGQTTGGREVPQESATEAPSNECVPPLSDHPKLLLPLTSGQIFFHLSDIEGGTTLRPGDTVEFVMHVNPKNGGVMAAQVRRSGEASVNKAAKSSGSGKQVGDGDQHHRASSTSSHSTRSRVLALQNPTKQKATGSSNPIGVDSQKSQQRPKMPDGTRGFAQGFRTKSLEVIDVGGDDLCIHEQFAGLKLRVPKLLRPDAESFVPSGATK